MRKVLGAARALAWAALASLVFVPTARAHGIVGNRMFIEPLVTEDANVKNELDLPSMEFQVQPDGTWRAAGFSFEKTLYPRRFSILLENWRIYEHTNGRRLAGWDNLEAGIKWQGITIERREFVLSPALFATFPTSSTRIVDHHAALRPMLLFGKGLGDLPVGWLRPFAIQGDLGYEASVSGPRNRMLIYDEVVMYSLPYLDHWVRHADSGYTMEHHLRRGLSPGAIFGNLFPFVEFNSTKAVQGTPGGASSALRPGILWMGKYVQISAAADFPVQAPGLVRPHTGAAVLVDWFLDELVPAFNWTPFGKGMDNHHD